MQATGVRPAAALIVVTALLSAVAVASREPVRGPIGVETQPSEESGSSPAPRRALGNAAPAVRERARALRPLPDARGHPEQPS